MTKNSHKAAVVLATLMVMGTSQAQNGGLNDRDPDGTWRFYMVQNGRVMTADDFTAWMSQRGLSIGRRASNTGSHTSHVQRAHYQPSRVHIPQGERLVSIYSSAIIPQGQAPSQISRPHIAQWEPATQPLATAPQVRPQVDENGTLTGYDSSWDEGGVSYSSGYYSGYGSGGYSSGSSQPLSSYDSGRDY